MRKEKLKMKAISIQRYVLEIDAFNKINIAMIDIKDI